MSVQLVRLLACDKVQVPLGLPAWKLPGRKHETRKWVASLGIHNYNGSVYFHEVLNALTLKVLCVKYVHSALVAGSRLPCYFTVQQAIQNDPYHKQGRTAQVLIDGDSLVYSRQATRNTGRTGTFSLARNLAIGVWLLVNGRAGECFIFPPYLGS